MPNPLKVIRFVVIFPALVCLADAQSTDIPEEHAPLQLSAAVESNYTWSPDSPPAGAATNLDFLRDVGQARLSEATLGLTGDWGLAGFHLEGGAGDFYTMAMANDSWKGPNDYISQAYFTLKPFAEVPLTIDGGKFFSSVGAETPHAYDNFNTSRSLLFWYGSPLYHAGVRSSLALSKGFTVGAQLLSGCDSITGVHGHQTMAFTGGWTGKHWGWSQLYMGGNEKTTGSGWRQLSDSIVTVNPASKVTAYLEFLDAAEKRTIPGYDRWYGFATAWKLSPAKRWSFSPRIEWYDDATGATTGLKQTLQAATFTAEYHASSFAVTRLEYRNQWSNTAYADPVTFPPSTQPLGLYPGRTLIAGVTLLFQHGL